MACSRESSWIGLAGNIAVGVLNDTPGITSVGLFQFFETQPHFRAIFATRPILQQAHCLRITLAEGRNDKLAGYRIFHVPGGKVVSGPKNGIRLTEDLGCATRVDIPGYVSGQHSDITIELGGGV